jgi:hypothetical protein
MQRREGAKTNGMRIHPGLVWIGGGIIVEEPILPSFFFVLFVAFVVKQWVAARGRSWYSVVN